MTRSDGVWSVGATLIDGEHATGVVQEGTCPPRPVKLFRNGSWSFRWEAMDDGKIPDVVNVVANCRTNSLPDSNLVDYRRALSRDEYAVVRPARSESRGVLLVDSIDLTPFRYKVPWMLVYLSAYVEYPAAHHLTTRVYMPPRRALSL